MGDNCFWRRGSAMLFFWYLAISAAQAQPGSRERAVPVTKSCPDGSTIIAVDTCAPSLDHRYLLTHQPSRHTVIQRWWCGPFPSPSEVGVTFGEQQPTGQQGSDPTVHHLDFLRVYGVPASPTLLRTVRGRVSNTKGLYNISARCLNVRSGRTMPVLVLHYDAYGQRGTSEVLLR
jgi:hypothetical protein